MFRQGDVFIRQVSEIPTEYTEIEKDKEGRSILAYGEVTGHAHAIKSNDVKMVSANDRVFLIVIKDCEINHEEHSKIKLPPGKYEVIKQKEYIQRRMIEVAD